MDINLLIKHAFVASMMCVLLYAATREGGVLFFIRQWVNRANVGTIGEWLKTPVFECLTCMCSVWGTAYYLITFWEAVNWWDYVRLVMAIGGINFIVDISYAYFQFIYSLENDRPNE